MTPDPNQLHFIPGDHPADYRYLFEGHSELLTDLENRAWRRILMSRKRDTTDSPVQRGMMTRHWMEVEEGVTRMLQQGEQRFFAATFERVLRERNPSVCVPVHGAVLYAGHRRPASVRTVLTLGLKSVRSAP